MTWDEFGNYVVIGILFLFAVVLILLYVKFSSLLEKISDWRYRRGKGSTKSGVSKHEKELGFGEANMSSQSDARENNCLNCGRATEPDIAFCPKCGERQG